MHQIVMKMFPKFSSLIGLFLILPSTVDSYLISGNLCWSMPCLNGGSCFGSSYAYLCVCTTKFTGSQCEIELGICQENPCGNRGLCIETSLRTFQCRCYSDFIGPTCQEQIYSENQPRIWSSLLPVHTKTLFDLFQTAYQRRTRGRSFLIAKNNEIDFLGLLTTERIATSLASQQTTTQETLTSDTPTTDAPLTMSMNETENSTAITNINSRKANPIRTENFSNLCRDVIAQILPKNVSSTIIDLVPNKYKHAINQLFQWLREHFQYSGN